MYEKEKKAEASAVSQRVIEAYKAIIKKPKAPSKAAFCAALGISASNWSKYERGERPFDLTSIIAITTSYRVSPNYLLFGEGELFLTPGEPFLPNTSPTSDSHNIQSKKNYGNIAGTIHGSQTQNNGPSSTQLDLEKQLEASKRENELLKQQLIMAQALIAAKEETITLLRGSYNRPN